MADAGRQTPILRTKLYRPPITADYVRRETLESRLEAGFELPLTVVAAPPGYGKSTLVSFWLQTRGRCTAWLSLDVTDSDIPVFAGYLVAALRTAAGDDACGRTLELLQSETPPPSQVLADQLSNDVDALDDRVLLVLDDYHRITEPAVHALVDRLLEHPPRQLHLAILSRRDPPLSLARLRASHLLTELRVRDLQFSHDETSAFLKQTVAAPVNPGAVARLHEGTEGWPVGIRLAALALRQADDVDSFLSHISVDSRPMREYLGHEVLSGQPPGIRDRLLSTAILRRFNAPLCEAVWGDDGEMPDANISGRDFIRAVEESGLFSIALDGQRNWFRFHHLFSDLLTRELEETLPAEAIALLHTRASAWFADNGYHEDAIEHALAAGDDTGAADILGHARHELMNRDEWSRLERWLKLFRPHVVEEQPQLMVLRCWLDLNHWYRLDVLARDLDRTERLLERSVGSRTETTRMQAEVSVIRSSLAYWTIEPSLGLSLTDRMVRDTSGEREYVQSVAIMYQAGAWQLLGQARRAEQLIRNSIEDGRLLNPGSEARLMQALCFIYWIEGDTRRVFRAASHLLEISVEHNLSWSLSFARYFLGLAHYERNELSDALPHFELVARDPYSYPIQNVAHCSFMSSLIHDARGEPARARERSDSILKLTFERGNKLFIDLAEAFQAELDLRQGNLARAVHWANTFTAFTPHTFHRYFNAEFTAIRSLMARDTRQSREAANGLLDSLGETMRRSHHRRLMIEVLGLRAILADAAGERESALSLLRDAVLTGQPGHLVRPLVNLGPEAASLLNRLDLDDDALEYVGAVHSAFHGTQDGPQGRHPDLPETLSRRELEILDLFAKDLSNKEIACRLFISPGTVKRHAHNIYGKMAVSNRRDAVAKAIRLGILVSN